jgi:hypothetical protein
LEAGTEAMKINDVDVRLANPQYRVDASGAGAPAAAQNRPDPRLVDLDGVPTPLSGVDLPKPEPTAAAGSDAPTPTIDVVV